MSSKLISIIIPVYNCEKYLEGTLKSILNQDTKGIEIILINDCSPDNSAAICSKYSKKHENIKFIDLEKNSGVSHARNVGIKESIGKYLLFIDSDDTVTSDSLKIYKDILETQDCDILVTGSNILENGNICETRRIGKDIFLTNKEEIKEFLKHFNVPDKDRVLHVVWNKVYSAKIIKTNKLYFNEDIDLGEDFLFNCAYFKYINSYRETTACTYNYVRRDSGNLTTKFRTNILERRKLMYSTWISLYEYYNIYDKEIAEFFEEVEGFLMYNCLFSVFSPNCELTEQEKKDFLKIMIGDPHLFLVLKYLKKGKIYNAIKNKDANMLYKYMKYKMTIRKMIRFIKK